VWARKCSHCARSHTHTDRARTHTVLAWITNETLSNEFNLLGWEGEGFLHCCHPHPSSGSRTRSSSTGSHFRSSRRSPSRPSAAPPWQTAVRPLTLCFCKFLASQILRENVSFHWCVCVRGIGMFFDNEEESACINQPIYLSIYLLSIDLSIYPYMYMHVNHIRVHIYIYIYI
jgi:hypothetical protein